MIERRPEESDMSLTARIEATTLDAALFENAAWTECGSTHCQRDDSGLPAPAHGDGTGES